MKSKLAINILVCLISLFLFLLAAEIILRFSWKMGGWGKRPIYQRSVNPYLRYELIPNSKTGLVVINSYGFRGREYLRVRPKNIFRIVMLGDSETLAFKLPEEESLPSQLEHLMKQNLPHKRCEVLNCGVEGYNTAQELEQLKIKAIKFDPNLIILNYVLNDPESAGYCLSKDFFTRHSALVRYFTYLTRNTLIKQEKRKLGINSEVENFRYLHSPKYFKQRVEDPIKEMAAIAKARGSKLVVVIIPTSSIEVKDFKENYPYRALHELVKGIDSGNIIFIDLIQEYNRLGLTPQTVSINYAVNESHKNALALKVAANYIYNTLKSEKLLP